MKWKLLVLALLVVVSATLLWNHWTKNELQTVSYEVPAPISSPLRIVHLSDLHSWSFGENNGELVELVKTQSPDLILMTGDMLDMTDAETKVDRKSVV